MWQLEHPVRWWLDGDELCAYESGAGCAQAPLTERESSSNRCFGARAHPLYIGDGEQEQVQRTGLAVAALDVVLSDQAVIHLTEVLRDAATTLRSSRRLRNIACSAAEDVVDQKLEPTGGARDVLL